MRCADMRFFKKILGGINYNNAKNLYGTVEDWEAASPSELKNIKKTLPKLWKQNI